MHAATNQENRRETIEKFRQTRLGRTRRVDVDQSHKKKPLCRSVSILTQRFYAIGKKWVQTETGGRIILPIQNDPSSEKAVKIRGLQKNPAKLRTARPVCQEESSAFWLRTTLLSSHLRKH